MASAPPTSDLRVVATAPLVAPQQLQRELPLSAAGAANVTDFRREVEAILDGSDRRLLVIVGPCSIHEPRSALDYARRLLALRRLHRQRLMLCMRVYFEKPRTSLGWKGLINDPHLDGSCDVPNGLRVARRLLTELAEIGIPAATEMLDPIVPQYIADAVSWAAIGARTTESQTHREMASGLSMPVGLKNGTDGSLSVAINAMKAARQPHSFLGIDAQGQVCVVRTAGNPYSHVVLRGGSSGANYAATQVDKAAAELRAAGMADRVLVDCSHANSGKDYQHQPIVVADIAAQVRSGSPHILGVMIESHLVGGRQDLGDDPSQLVYGQSITDACIDFATTEQTLQTLADAVAASGADILPRAVSF